MWGAEIPVTIVDRKPDFVGDGDVCDVWEFGNWCSPQFFNEQILAKSWIWNKNITAVRLLANHPYYTKEKTMKISREAAIEAIKENGYTVCEDRIRMVIAGGGYKCTRNLAKARQRLWDLVPSERPVDNRVIAMRHVLAKLDEIAGGAQLASQHINGLWDDSTDGAIAMSALYHAKLAELGAGSECWHVRSGFR